MTDENKTPQFSEDKVDDLLASHGREPSKKDMGMIEAMIAKERLRQEIQKKNRERAEARKNKRFKGRSR